VYQHRKYVSLLPLPFLTTSGEVRTPQTLRVSDIITIKNLHEQLEHLLAVVSEFVGAHISVKESVMQFQGVLDKVVQSCEENMKLASSACYGQFEKVKSLVAEFNESLELDLNKIRTEVLLLASTLKTWIINSLGQVSTASTVPLLASTEESKLSTASDSLCKENPAKIETDGEIGCDDQKIIGTDSRPLLPTEHLPPDAALNDLTILHNMGFTDTSTNLVLLQLHKGDLSLVVNDLLMTY